jgi:hypothetical protein
MRAWVAEFDCAFAGEISFARPAMFDEQNLAVKWRADEPIAPPRDFKNPLAAISNFKRAKARHHLGTDEERPLVVRTLRTPWVKGAKTMSKGGPAMLPRT